MNAERTIPIMARTDIETKVWINKHPLSQSDLINYGLHLIRMVEKNILSAQTVVTSIGIDTALDELLPF